MKYIIPKYIELKKEKDGFALINHYIRGKIKITDVKIVERIEYLQKYGTDKIENEIDYFLASHKYLILEELAGNEALLMKSYMDEVLIVTIIPTMNCNFKCVYCYENKNNERLGFDAYTNIINFIEEKVFRESIKIIKVNWFGGEPLLAFQEIIDFHKALINRLGKRIKIISGMTTNGYLLTAEIYKMLYSVGIKEFQITLDGTEHDRMRIGIDGKGTYHVILNNLQNIVKMTDGYGGRIIIRTNLTKVTDIRSVKLFFRDISSLFQDNRFFLVVKCVRNWGNLKLSCDQLIIEEECDNTELSVYRLAQEMKIRTLYEERKASKKVCYAMYKNAFIFKPNGEIVKCSLDLDNPKNIVGEIAENGILIDEDKNKVWDISKYKMTDHCFGCKRKEIMG